jgi:hypothetical protein
MKIKRFAAGACALALCLGMTACGGSDTGSSSTGGATESKTETTTTTAAESREEVSMKEEHVEKLESIAEKLEGETLENTDLKFFSHWDINPPDGGTVSPELKLWREKYNGTFTWVQTTWDKRYDDLAALVMAKDSPDFFSAMDMDGFPRGAIKGMFDPIDDYIDYNSDLWKPAKTVADNFVFNGKHYVAAIGGYPDIVCVYNTKTIEDKGYDDPAELYWDDQWTWSKFKEMCVDFADAEKDIAGLDGWWYPTAMNNICGVPIIGLKDGKLVNNMKDPAVTKMQDLIYDLQKNNVVFDRGKHGNQPRDNATNGAGLGTHETLFVPIGLWGIESQPDSVTAFGDVEAGEIMFVPMPRLDDGDTYYMSTRVDGYFLVKNAPNPKGFKAFMECRMLAKQEAEEIAKEQRKEDYKWNDAMIAMRDETIRLANEHPVFTFNSSVSDDLTNIMNTVAGATTNTWANDEGVSDGQTSWTQTVEQNSDNVDFILKDINDNIDGAAAKE